MTENRLSLVGKRRAADFLKQAKASGLKGASVRWGDHGPTKCVRAYSDTVDRFREAIPQERDRAAAATAALDAYLDAGNLPCRAAQQLPPVTVAAVLTYHWYDEIEAGRKKVEYRDICDYWDAKLWDNGIAERIAAIRFSRGYTKTKMTWEVKRIDRNEGESQYEIHLGKRLS